MILKFQIKKGFFPSVWTVHCFKCLDHWNDNARITHLGLDQFVPVSKLPLPWTHALQSPSLHRHNYLSKSVVITNKQLRFHSWFKVHSLRSYADYVCILSIYLNYYFNTFFFFLQIMGFGSCVSRQESQLVPMVLVVIFAGWFQVFEVNASSRRSGKQILAQLQEATLSHQVSKKNVDQLCTVSATLSNLHKGEVW